MTHFATLGQTAHRHSVRSVGKREGDAILDRHIYACIYYEMKVIRWMEVPLPVHQLRAVGAVAISAAQTDECYCRKPQLTMVVQAALL